MSILAACVPPMAGSGGTSRTALWPWMGWEGQYDTAQPTPETLEEFRVVHQKSTSLYTSDEAKGPGSCDELRIALDVKFKGIEPGEGVEIDEGIFDVSVDPALPIERGVIANPLETSLVALGRPVTVTVRPKGRPQLTRTLQHTFGVECEQTIKARSDTEYGLHGKDGNDASSARDASGGTSGDDARDGGVIEADAAWVQLAGKRYVLVVARVQDRKDGTLQPPRTAIALAPPDYKITLEARGQAGGSGGDGGYGGCTSNGGDGGAGGDGGSGGPITVRVSDQAILASLVIDADPGRAGEGGDPGKVEQGCGRLHEGARGKSGSPGAKAGAVTTKVVPVAQLELMKKAVAATTALQVK